MCGVGFTSLVFKTDSLSVNQGFSPIWLLSMYIFGGYVKLHGKYLCSHRKILYFMIYLLSSCFALLGRIVILKVPILTHYLNTDIFIRYNSFPIVINAIALFLLFLKINVSDNYKKIIAFVSNISFSVYLIHEHPLVRDKFISGKFSHFFNFSSFGMVYMILYTGLVIYVLCTLIDIFRYYLFKILKVDKLSDYIDKKIVCLLTKKG